MTVKAARKSVLNGKVYLGAKLNAAYKYPHLLAEAEAVGIRVETREP